MESLLTVQHKVCEIGEEEFNPDIEQLEQARLEVITRNRTIIRDKIMIEGPHRDHINGDNGAFDQDLDDDSDQDDSSLFSGMRLHGNLRNVSAGDSLRALPLSIGIPPEQHDYINQDVLDEATRETSASATSECVPMTGRDDEDGHIKRVASSNGYKSRGTPSTRHKKRDRDNADEVVGNLSEFEKHLFMAKHMTHPAMPDIYEIPWYHPGIARHVAECLLLSKSIKDGTYLLRDCVSEEDTVTLSVRCAESVKHYKVMWDGRQFMFGLGKFPTLDDFKEHFLHQPVISGDSGVLVRLCHPYPRGVSEPAIYHEANVICNRDIPPPPSKPAPSRPAPSKPAPYKQMPLKASPKPNKGSRSPASMDLSVNSKEGYLTKLGFHRKNWKKRWFVLYRNELKYFNNCGDKEPLKTINLEDVMKVERDISVGKPNCLRLVTSYRTFYMYAGSEVEAIEWLQILDWRLKQQSKQISES